MADEKTTCITAQIPADILEQLRIIAKSEGRSLSSQIRLFLADAVTRHNTATQAKAA